MNNKILIFLISFLMFSDLCFAKKPAGARGGRIEDGKIIYTDGNGDYISDNKNNKNNDNDNNNDNDDNHDNSAFGPSRDQRINNKTKGFSGFLKMFLPSWPVPWETRTIIGVDINKKTYFSYHGLFSGGQIAILVSSLFKYMDYRKSGEKYTLKEHLKEYKYEIGLYPILSTLRFFSHKFPKKSW